MLCMMLKMQASRNLALGQAVHKRPKLGHLCWAAPSQMIQGTYAIRYPASCMLLSCQTREIWFELKARERCKQPTLLEDC